MSMNCYYTMNSPRSANLHSNVQKPVNSTQNKQPSIKASLDLTVNPNSGLMPFLGVSSSGNLNPSVQREGHGKKLNLMG